MKNYFIVFVLLTAFSLGACQAQKKIPEVYTNIKRDKDGRLYLEWREGQKAYQVDRQSPYTIEQLMGSPQGTETGIAFDFQDPGFQGLLYYGFIHQDDGAYPYPVYFKSYEMIRGGKAHIDILNELSGRYDMVDWEENGKGMMGYRILSPYGEFLYDGKIVFEGVGPFETGITIVEGPFLGIAGPENITVSFTTNMECNPSVQVNGNTFASGKKSTEHVIEVGGLTPDTKYEYTIEGVSLSAKYSFRTAPFPGSRNPFTFAYASDSREGQGGGERNIYGVNAYIMKKIMALSLQQEARFFQFTGDLITGYTTDKDAQDLEYANWKRAVEPFWHHIPMYVGFGNHEALEFQFRDTIEGTPVRIRIDRFPFETESSEAVYAKNFVMPENGPESEDGAVYDPDPKKINFPSYKETVFHYSYDNVGMIVLNSDYWYSSSAPFIRYSGGGLHGYLMDRQMDWFEETLAMFEADPNIDHVFVTQHTPAFPNGGHVHDDMWYHGKNDWRPYVAGKPLAKGIIERRDEYLDMAANKSTKVLALLTGDEHNYNRMLITDDMPRYPEVYFPEKLKLDRDIWQINNGAAGAPYYAQEITPWSEHVIGFTTQNALVLFDVEGKKVSMRVINPDTLELIDEAVLRE